MGKLAAWGAVAGAGKGAADYLEKRQSEEISVRAAEIDNQRKIAFERLQQQNREALETMRQTGATERTGMTVDGAAAVADTRAESEMAQIEARGDLQQKLQDDAQKHAIDLENIQIKAGKYARSASGQDPRIKAMVDRYEFRQETTSGFDPTTNLPTETGVTVMTDKVSGQSYVQKDDKFIPRGSDREPTRAPSAATNALYENLHRAPEFLDKFGYLPLGFFAAKREFDLAQEGYGQLGTPQE